MVTCLARWVGLGLTILIDAGSGSRPGLTEPVKLMGWAFVFASLPSLVDRWRSHRAGLERGLPPWNVPCDGGGTPSLFERLDWDSVEADELVFLHPALALARRPTHEGALPVCHVRRALIARIRIVVAHVSARANPTAMSPAGALRVLEQVCSDTTFSARESWLSGEGVVALGQFYPSAEATRPHDRPVAFGEFRLSAEDVLACESLVLEVLLRALVHISERDVDPSAAGREVDVAEGVVLSLYSGMNAAYVYRHLDWAHELMTTAAWLGMLVRGRAAWLPSPVAVRLDELGERASRASKATLDLSDWVLWRHAVVACDFSRLFEAARKVAGTRCPVLVRPTMSARRGQVAVLGARALLRGRNGR